MKDSVLLDLHQNCGAESSASWNTNGGGMHVHLSLLNVVLHDLWEALAVAGLSLVKDSERFRGCR